MAVCSEPFFRVSLETGVTESFQSLQTAIPHPRDLGQFWRGSWPGSEWNLGAGIELVVSCCLRGFVDRGAGQPGVAAWKEQL